jgi:hypothetical protein
MKYKYFLTYCTIVLLAIVACSEETITPPASLFGSNFFPMQKGHTVDYKVKQITYKEFDPTDTLIYYLREEIGDTIPDLVGEGATQKLFRYTRNDTLSTWQLDSVWTVSYDFNRIIKSENNIAFIKLALPLNASSNWNGNALNYLGTQNYLLEDFLLPKADFDRTIKVIHRQDSSLVDKKIQWEIYAENVGMIESLNISLEYISDISDTFYGTDSISRGTYIYRKIIATKE